MTAKLDEAAVSAALEAYLVARADIRSRDRLFLAASTLARREALRLARRSHVDVDDAEQAARIGLLVAIDTFDPSRGAFVGFAVATIRHALYASKESGPTIRIPLAAVRQHRRRGAEDDHPLARVVASLDAPIADGDVPRVEAVGDDFAVDAAASFAEHEIRAAVFAHVAALPTREREAVEARFGFVDGDEKTLAEVADVLGGVSRERARQVCDSATRRLLLLIGDRHALE